MSVSPSTLGRVTRWTLADVARMRLLSQRLVAPLPDPVAAVRHLTCTQGQDLPGSTTSLALRTAGRSLEEVRGAYDAGQIIRSWPMRGTLFVVLPEDLRWMLELTAERTMASTARRRSELGIADAHLETAEAVARTAIPHDGLTRAEVLAAWTEAGLDVSEGRGYHTLFHLALCGVLCLGPMTGAEQRFVLVDRWVPAAPAREREEAVADWFTRYVRSHGPVRDAEFLWWTKLLRRDLAPVLDVATVDLTSIDVDGETHWVDPAVLEAYPDRKRATAAPLLLPGFDEVVLGYGDRSAVMTAEQERVHVVPGKNGVFRPTVIRAGRALGTWQRPTRRGATVTVTPFDPPLPGPVERALPRLTAALPS